MIRSRGLLLALVLPLLLSGCLLLPRQEEVPPELFVLPSAQTRKVNDVTIHILENGLTLIHRQNTFNDIAGVVCLINTGAASEPEEQAGVTNLMMRVLPKGTQKRSADEIAEELGELGTALSAGAGMDYCTVSMQCVNEDLDDALEIFSDVLLHPNFPLDEIDLERKRVLAEIRMSEDSSPSYVSKRWKKELYGGHPYGRPIQGEPETLAPLGQRELYQLHEDFFVPSNMVITVVGNVDFEKTKALIEKHLGMASRPVKEHFRVDKIVAPGGKRIELSKDVEQGFIILGHLVAEAGHPDEPALEVAANVLGGGMSSRLFVELRDRQGLAYSVGASASFHQKKGSFLTFIGTKAESIDKAADGLWQQIENLRDEPVSEEELERAKKYIAGRYLRGHERNISQARYLGYWYVSGRGVEYDEKYLEIVNAVTSRDVMRVANKYFLDPTVAILRPQGAAETAATP